MEGPLQGKKGRERDQVDYDCGNEPEYQDTQVAHIENVVNGNETKSRNVSKENEKKKRKKKGDRLKEHL